METVHSPQAPNDKQELVPTVAAIAAEAGPVTTVLADNGLYSETAVQSGADHGRQSNAQRGRSGKETGASRYMISTSQS